MTDILGLEDTKADEASPFTEAPVPPTEGTEKVTEVHSDSAAFEAAAAEADAILDKLLADIAPVGVASPYRRFLIYGDPGTQKTSFACGQGCDPRFGPGVLNMLVEKGGDVSLENHPECSDVSILKFKALAQVEALISKLAENPPQLDKFHTVVVDTFTTLQERDLRDLAIRAAQLDSSRNPNVNIGSDYQQNNNHMRSIARKLADLERNVVIICHVKEEKDDSTGRMLWRPNLTPKLASAMAGMFDMVGFMTVQPVITDEGKEKLERRLQVHPTNQVIAKTRLGDLPAVMVEPKITDLLKAESYKGRGK